MSFDLDIAERYKYIYLIHPETFESKGIPIYKYGRTHDLNNRFNTYPKNSIIYYVCRVADCHHTEDEVKKAFLKHFKQRKEYGIEYFEGNMSKMIECIDTVIEKMKQHIPEEGLVDKVKRIYDGYHRIRIGEILDIIPSQNAEAQIKNTKDLIPHTPHSNKATKIDGVAGHRSHPCDTCGRIFLKKPSLEYHKRHNVCESKKYKCRYCVGVFSTKSTMYRHMRLYCKEKNNDGDQKNTDIQSYICDKFLEIQEEHKQIKEEHNKRVHDNNEAVQNTMIDTGGSKTIKLVKCGKEDLTVIDKKNLYRTSDTSKEIGLKNGFNFISLLIREIHFNSSHPENHNIYIPSMKDKYAMSYDGCDWNIVLKQEMIDRLYDDKKTFIEENIDDFAEFLTPAQKRRIKEWLETDDHQIIKNDKESIFLLLYNKRHMALNVKKNMSKTTKTNQIKQIETPKQAEQIKEANAIIQTEEIKQIEAPKQIKTVKRTKMSEQISQPKQKKLHIKRKTE